MKHANTLIQQAADFIGYIQSDEPIQQEIKSKQTERATALKILHRFQRYRRGKGSYSDIGYSAKEIGMAIDIAIRELRSHFRPMK